MTHLLPLASLPPAALAVIFGPDGTFAGAPTWDPPVFWLNQYIRWGWLRSQASFEHLILPDLALDLRIPSVAARLLRICSFVESVDPNLEPAEIASLTISLADRIGALPAGVDPR